jgi:hypothetical protein
VVSTPALKKRLNQYNTSIIVIPNSINTEAIKTDKSKKIDKTVFGYLISPDNQQYLFSILEQLRTVLTKYRNNVIFQIAGHHTTGLSKELFGDLPVEILTPAETSFNSYIKWIVNDLNWDFGIAPLLKNDFTLYKSDMKFLDFTRMGIPGVYTNFEPYRNVKEHNAGLMVDSDWVKAIGLMIEDEKQRNGIFKLAKEYVLKERNLETQIAAWKTALATL